MPTDPTWSSGSNVPLVICRPCGALLGPGKALKCSGCKSDLTLYCGPVCQKDDWRRHKAFCKDSSRVESSLEEISLTSRHELMLRNGLEAFRNLPPIQAALRTALINAYRIGSPSPLYLTHVLHLTYYFDPRETDPLDQFTLCKGELLTHAATANKINYLSRKANTRPVTAATFTQAGQRATFGSLGPDAEGQDIKFLPVVSIATFDPALVKVTKSLSSAFHYDTVVMGSMPLDFFRDAVDLPDDQPPVVPPVDYDWAARFRRAVSRQGRKKLALIEKEGSEQERGLTPSQEKERDAFVSKAPKGSGLETVWTIIMRARELHDWSGPEV